MAMANRTNLPKVFGFDCTLSFHLFVVVISQSLVSGVVSVWYVGCDSGCGCSLHLILRASVLAGRELFFLCTVPGGFFQKNLSPCQVGNDPGCHWRWSRYTKDERIWCEIPRVTCSKWDFMRYLFSKDSWSCGTAFCYGLFVAFVSPGTMLFALFLTDVLKSETVSNQKRSHHCGPS